MSILRSGWTRQCVLQHDPFTWLATQPNEIYDAATASDLLAAFPTDSFTRVDASAEGRSKTYRNYSRILVAVEEPGPSMDRLPMLWQRMIAELSAMDYRSDIAALLDQPVASALEIRLVRHSKGDWLSPHTDREDKLFSHVFYFNRGWREEWGGCLEILASGDPSPPAARVVPVLGVTTLLARSEKSWHQVTKVTEAAQGQRTSLLVHGMQ